MAHNSYPNTYNNHQRRQPGGVAAYLMGMAPMPPPSSQDIAVAMANHMLDHPDQDANIDLVQNMQNARVHHMGTINVRIPINNGRTTRDIKFDASIPRADFMSRVCAAMDVPVAGAELGWKSNDDPVRAPARQLTTDEELRDAFRSLLTLKNSTHRKKVTMLIVHLNPRPAELPKTDGIRSTDFTYADELRLVQEKLKCEQHNGPNCWCYATGPGNPNEHVALGLEEVTLWARKLKDDPTLDRECITPPNVLSLDKLQDRANHSTRPAIKSTPSVVPVHVHITNTPFAGTSNNSTQNSWRNLKRTFSAMSSSSEDETDAESLLLSDILADLHTKFPLLNLPQYESILADHGIVYASSVHDFSRDYYIDLGMSEGAVGPFMKGVARTLHHERKHAKLDDKENYIIRARDESVSL